MPALKYYNHEGMQQKGGYSTQEWATIGKKIVSKLGSGYQLKGGKIARKGESAADEDETVVAAEADAASKKTIKKIITKLDKMCDSARDLIAELARDDDMPDYELQSLVQALTGLNSVRRQLYWKVKDDASAAEGEVVWRCDECKDEVVEGQALGLNFQCPTCGRFLMHYDRRAGRLATKGGEEEMAEPNEIKVEANEEGVVTIRIEQVTKQEAPAADLSLADKLTGFMEKYGPALDKLIAGQVPVAEAEGAKPKPPSGGEMPAAKGGDGEEAEAAKPKPKSDDDDDEDEVKPKAKGEEEAEAAKPKPKSDDDEDEVKPKAKGEEGAGETEACCGAPKGKHFSTCETLATAAAPFEGDETWGPMAMAQRAQSRVAFDLGTPEGKQRYLQSLPGAEAGAAVASEAGVVVASKEGAAEASESGEGKGEGEGKAQGRVPVGAVENVGSGEDIDLSPLFRRQR